MRRVALVLLSATALLSVADLAQARDGCGPGRFYDGYRCAPMGGGYGPGPGYGPSPGFYEGGPRYREGYGGGGGAIIRQNNYGQPERYFRVGPRGQCPPRYTVQDGLCKPYRGY